jgi:hypothetical protein
VGRRSGNRAAILRSKTHRHGPWLFRSPVFGSGHSTTRRRGGRRPPPREDPAQTRHALAGGFDAPPAPALSSAGDDSRPHHAILDRKIAARLFRRFPRPVESRVTPDSYFPQWVLPLRRPHNHQLRTAMVTANWRGCEGDFGAFYPSEFPLRTTGFRSAVSQSSLARRHVDERGARFGDGMPRPLLICTTLAVCVSLPFSASARENRSALVKREFQLTHPCL